MAEVSGAWICFSIIQLVDSDSLALLIPPISSSVVYSSFVTVFPFSYFSRVFLISSLILLCIILSAVSVLFAVVLWLLFSLRCLWTPSTHTHILIQTASDGLTERTELIVLASCYSTVLVRRRVYTHVTDCELTFETGVFSCWIFDAKRMIWIATSNIGSLKTYEWILTEVNHSMKAFDVYMSSGNRRPLCTLIRSSQFCSQPR